MQLILLLLFTFISCETPPQRTISSYYGVEEETNQTSCNQQTLEIVCRNELAQTRQFKQRCLNQNKKIIQCDCDDYLCVDSQNLESDSSSTLIESIEQNELGNILRDSTKVYNGIDYEGVERSCSPLVPGFMCNAEFTKEDEYGLECRKEGIDIVFCGCHDPICLL